MADPSWTPAGADLVTPNTARIYDYLLGGKDNFAADRKVAEELLAIIPEAKLAAQENHAFIARAVRHVAATGVQQFIDIGAKLPGPGNVHEVATSTAPDARVVFATNDPVSLAHARAMLSGTAPVTVAQIDLLCPEQILALPETQGLIDLTEPVAIVLDRVLHFIEDTEAAAASVARLRDAISPGSFVIFSHITQDPQPEAAPEVTKTFEKTTDPFQGRTFADIRGLFDGMSLLPPGLTYTSEWRPDGPPMIPDPKLTYTLAGVAQKP